MPVRLCGTRIAGGVYIECGFSPIGEPLEYFLIDPPIPVTKADIGLASVGVKLAERNGVAHVIDWVGMEHYPRCVDFIEETRRLGLSRRISSNFPFERLSRDSRIYLIHPKAYVANPSIVIDAWQASGAPLRVCPKAIYDHADLSSAVGQSCCRSHWAPTAATEQAQYAPAFFMCLPITNLAVVHDPLGGKHDAAYAKASAAGVDVYEVKE